MSGPFFDHATVRGAMLKNVTPIGLCVHCKVMRALVFVSSFRSVRGAFVGDCKPCRDKERRRGR